MGIGHFPRVPADRKPMQVRFFQEGDIADLETAINHWLAVSPRREIVDIRQSVLSTQAGGRELLVSVWYIDD
ncbi:MAG: hypothetical protein ACREL7_10930 [Longimicrobiales bacterium]